MQWDNLLGIVPEYKELICSEVALSPGSALRAMAQADEEYRGSIALSQIWTIPNGYF